jgi:hypothetical protein
VDPYLVLTVDPVDHELDELGATWHVGIERHDTDTEVARDLSHRQGRQTLGVGDCHTSSDDVGETDARPRPTYWRLLLRCPEQLDDSAALGCTGMLICTVRLGHIYIL